MAAIKKVRLVNALYRPPSRCAVLHARSLAISTSHPSHANPRILTSTTEVRSDDILLRNVATDKKPWRILTALCMVRKNTLTKHLPDIAIEYSKLQSWKSISASQFNDYELNTINIEEQIAAIRGKETMSDHEESSLLDFDRGLGDIREQEEEYQAEGESPGVTDRATSEDEDASSLQRCLAEDLHYLVKDRSTLASERCVYPHAQVEKQQTLRETAERIAASQGFEPDDYLILSNSPIGYMDVDTDDTDVYRGTKMFFMKAQLVRNNPTLHAEGFRWSTRTEMQQNLEEEYFCSVDKFVF